MGQQIVGPGGGTVVIEMDAHGLVPAVLGLERALVAGDGFGDVDVIPLLFLADGFHLLVELLDREIVERPVGAGAVGGHGGDGFDEHGDAGRLLLDLAH